MPHTDTLAETMDFWLQVYDKPGLTAEDVTLEILRRAAGTRD